MFQFNKMANEDINSRYNNAIILVNGRLFICYDSDKHNLEGRYLNEENTSVISTKHNDINTQSPKLGYLNYGNHTTYVSRIPVRFYRHGLNVRNLVSFSPTDGRRRDTFSFLEHNTIFSEGLQNTIHNKYPTFKQCIVKVGTLKSRIRSNAFDRESALVSVNGVINVYFGTTKVGKVVEDMVILDDEHMYLKEYFGELDVPIH